MDLLLNLAHGAGHVFEPVNLCMIVLGLMVGVIVGALPGIAMINAMILALPFTYNMSSVPAILLLLAIYCGGMFGGAITAILINMPGSPGNAPTVLDGYPMARQGRAAEAIGYAIICSGIGGLASALFMTFASPSLADFAMRFTAVEKFSIVLLGVVCVVGIGTTSISASLISLFIGMLLGCVGVAPIYASYRLTFGMDMFAAGISFVIALIGVFAVSEVFSQAATVYTLVTQTTKATVTFPSIRDLWRLRSTILRAIIFGTGVGVIPGEGGAAAAFISYGIEKQASPNGHLFGTGVVEGVVAPETANNATTGGAMVPLLTLGIPGSGAAAVILGCFMLHGLQPGPLLFIKDLDLVYTLFVGMILINILMIFTGNITTRIFLQCLRIPSGVLMAFIMVLCFIGAYGMRNNVVDIWVMLAFGYLGYFLKKHSFSPVPMVMGIILGPMAETYFHTSMIQYDNNVMVFFTRPISLSIIALSVLLLFLPRIMKLKNRRNAKGATA